MAERKRAHRTPTFSQAPLAEEPTIAEMINRRFIGITLPSGRPMHAYFGLEEREEQFRAHARIQHSVPLALWLRFLTLFGLAFSKTYSLDDLKDTSEIRAKSLALDLLGLAATTAKPAVDAIVVGYYSQAYGLIRTMLETWRRAAYLRLFPQGIEKWWPEVDETERAETSEPIRLDPPDAKRTANKLNEIGSDNVKAGLEMIGHGIRLMHGGSHPSVEGVTQLWEEGGRRIFGPNYKKEHCEFGLEWGLIACLFLAGEIQSLFPQSQEWVDELLRLDTEVRSWVYALASEPEAS